MYTVVIAGAGQLGSRHLQGIKTSSLELDIWVYDLSVDSLKVAKERYEQISSSVLKNVHYVQSMKDIPNDIDVAIIASSSKPRYAIVTELLSNHKVSYMVLEKFLFPRMTDYDEIGVLFKKKGVKAFVNCPRRMLDSYNLIKQRIDYSQPIEMAFAGHDWGLCCNSIHFIDIFMHLSNSTDYSMNIDEIVPEIIESKRCGYIELRGTEKIQTSNGSTLTLSSYKVFDGDSIVTIKNAGNIIKINEANGEIIINGVLHKTNVKYQSALSGLVVDDLIKTGNCPLTPYSSSSSYHKTFLSIIAPYIKKLSGSTSESCPIT